MCPIVKPVLAQLSVNNAKPATKTLPKVDLLARSHLILQHVELVVPIARLEVVVINVMMAII